MLKLFNFTEKKKKITSFHECRALFDIIVVSDLKLIRDSECLKVWGLPFQKTAQP